MKTKLQNFFLVLISFGIMLGGGEGAFRMLLSGDPHTESNAEQPLGKLIEFDAKLQTRYRPNVSGLIKSQYGEFEIGYATNALGLRDKSLEADGKQRILVLGNSLVEGWGVEEEAGFLRVAEQTVNQGRTRPLRLINAGISGFGAAQSYLLGSELLEQIEPDAVVFVYTSTMVQADYQFLLLAERDASNLATGLSSDALLSPVTNGRPSASAISGWLKVITPYSAMASFVERHLSARAARKAIQPGDPASDLLAGLRADKDSLAVLHTPSLAHVNALAQRTKSIGLPFLLVHLPMPHQISADEWSIGRKAYGLGSQVYPAHDVEIVRNFCKTNGIPCASAHEYLAHAITANPSNIKFYYRSDFHPTEAGYRAIGLWFATELRKIPLKP